MTQLGVAAASCKLAAHNGADPHTCGATGSPCACARAATLRASVSPPTTATSGCRKSAARCSTMSLKAKRVASLSRVATSIGTRRRTSPCSWSSASTGAVNRQGAVGVHHQLHVRAKLLPGQPPTLERTLRKVRLVQTADADLDGP